MIQSIRHWSERILPEKIFRVLFVHKYLHFFATGVTGVALNLVITWIFTRFVFGLEGYFSAYLIGVAINLIFNFTIHTIVTFKTKDRVAERMVGFLAYSLSMTTFQAWVVKTLTPKIGLEYYIFVIGGVIFVFSIVTFLLFKFFLFRNDMKSSTQAFLVPIFSAILLHITGFLEFRDDLPLFLLSLTPPIPHAFLATFLNFGGVVVTFLIIQIIISAIVLPFAVYKISQRLFGKKVGMIMLWVVALNPFTMALAWVPSPIIPFFCLFLSCAVLLFSIEGWHACRLCLWARIVGVVFLSLLASVVFPSVVFVEVLMLGIFGLWGLVLKDRYIPGVAFFSALASLLLR